MTHPPEVCTNTNLIFFTSNTFRFLLTEFLGEELDNYVATLPVRTKVLRLAQREGIVAARILGAKTATADTLTFLDAHCECTNG